MQHQAITTPIHIHPSTVLLPQSTSHITLQCMETLIISLTVRARKFPTSNHGTTHLPLKTKLKIWSLPSQHTLLRTLVLQKTTPSYLILILTLYCVCDMLASQIIMGTIKMLSCRNGVTCAWKYIFDILPVLFMDWYRT